MKLFSLKNTLTALFVGLFAFVLAGPVVAQNVNEEYREWQRAQQQAQEELRDYQRTRSRRDYRDYQQAQRVAQREYQEYLNTRNRTSSYRYNTPGNVITTSRPYYSNTGSRYYRVYRNGQYYRVDNRGAELLRQAVNRGYQQGFYEGQRDRQYGDRFSYYDESAYRTGTIGYQSYVARNQYQYYFQQGFQRGYEDGYYSRQTYGYRTNNGLSILGGVLGTILNLVDDND